MTTLATPVDSVTVERAAEAAYHATMTFAQDHVVYEPWDKLPEYWKRIYRVQVTAVMGVLS